MVHLEPVILRTPFGARWDRLVRGKKKEKGGEREKERERREEKERGKKKKKEEEEGTVSRRIYADVSRV